MQIFATIGYHFERTEVSYEFDDEGKHESETT